MLLCFHTIAFSPVRIWGNSYSLLETARILAEIGYEGLEVVATRPHAWPFDLSKSERKSVRNFIEQLGIKILSICPLMGPNFNPASLDPKEIRDAQRYIIECVRMASELGSPLVVYPAGWVVQGTSRKEAWKRSCDTLFRVAEEGKNEGVTLTIEAIRKEYCNLLWNSEQAVKMMNTLKHPNAKLMMDTIHVWAAGEDPINVISKYRENLFHVHLEDESELGEERRAPGEGVRDIVSIIKVLKNNNYTGALCVEIWGPEPERLAAKSYRYLKRLLSGQNHA